MLSSYLLLLLLTNHIPEISCTTTMPPCTWRYQWSDTSDLTTYLPPRNTSCHLYFSDMLSLVNADPTTHMLYKVNTQTEFDNCNSASPVHDVSIAPGTVFTVTINMGVFQLSALSRVYMISEVYNGGCLQLEFFINVDTFRDCDITTNTEGSCMVPRDTNATNATTMPTNTNMPTNSTNGTMATNMPTQVPLPQTGQAISGGEILLGILCFILALLDIGATGVLVLVCVYLPSEKRWSCEITRGGKGRGTGDRGTELKEGKFASWRQKMAL